ncbi:MAG: SGNH/GDSL hydrolase family protein [Acidimicrobiia bacterium]
MVLAAVAAFAALPSTAGASPHQELPRSYVALGDSYTAGPLVPLPVGQPIDCGRSDHNYPTLVAAALGITDFRDASCASAATRHLLAPQTGLFGGVNPPQLDALQPGTDLVTIGIGGNDIGFADLVAACLQPPAPIGSPCSLPLTAGGTDQVTDNIRSAAPDVAAVVQAAHQRSPGADVYLVGYPAVLPDEGTGCYPYFPVLPDDVPYLRAKSKELNAMLAEVARANDATYVDIYPSSVGHDACQLPGTAWVNGIVVVPPSAPVHPNELGLANAAKVVEAAVRAGPAESLSATDAAAAPTPAATGPTSGPAGSTGTGAGSAAAVQPTAIPATGRSWPLWPALALSAAAALARPDRWRRRTI